MTPSRPDSDSPPKDPGPRRAPARRSKAENRTRRDPSDSESERWHPRAPEKKSWEPAAAHRISGSPRTLTRARAAGRRWLPPTELARRGRGAWPAIMMRARPPPRAASARELRPGQPQWYSAGGIGSEPEVTRLHLGLTRAAGRHSKVPLAAGGLALRRPRAASAQY